MKTNYIGILGAIIAFISLVLPWWTITLSSTTVGITASVDANLYLYQLANSITGFSLANSWYAWSALALVIVGALLALAGSLTEKSRALLAGGGVLEIVAIIIFAVGLMMDLSNVSGYTGLGLFSGGSVTYETIFAASFSTYLSYGFWLALVAAIVMFAASAWKPRVEPTQPTATVTPTT